MLARSAGREREHVAGISHSDLRSARPVATSRQRLGEQRHFSPRSAKRGYACENCRLDFREIGPEQSDFDPILP
jgi:hypothetical protein